MPPLPLSPTIPPPPHLGNSPFSYLACEKRSSELESIFFHPPLLLFTRLWSFVTPIQSALVFSVTSGSKNGRRKSTLLWSVGRPTDGRRLIRQDRSKVLKWEGISKPTEEGQAGKKGLHFQRPRSEFSDVAIFPLEIGAAAGSSSTKKEKNHFKKKTPIFQTLPSLPHPRSRRLFLESDCA